MPKKKSKQRHSKRMARAIACHADQIRKAAYIICDALNALTAVQAAASAHISTTEARAMLNECGMLYEDDYSSETLQPRTDAEATIIFGDEDTPAQDTNNESE